MQYFICSSWDLRVLAFCQSKQRKWEICKRPEKPLQKRIWKQLQATEAVMPLNVEADWPDHGFDVSRVCFACHIVECISENDLTIDTKGQIFMWLVGCDVSLTRQIIYSSK